MEIIPDDSNPVSNQYEDVDEKRGCMYSKVLSIIYLYIFDLVSINIPYKQKRRVHE